MPIFCEITTCAPHDALTTQKNELPVGDLLEIGMIISGSGIHKIIGQTIPCKKGDIFIVPRGIPHGYFLYLFCHVSAGDYRIGDDVCVLNALFFAHAFDHNADHGLCSALAEEDDGTYSLQ